MNDNIDNLRDLEDSILDQYNEEKISEKEMQNILRWCEKQKKSLSSSVAES